MRQLYYPVFKSIFHDSLILTRNELGITQEKMASRLAMAERTYAYLEHGKTGCSALTLALYLLYACNDPVGFLEVLRNAFETRKDQVA